MTDTLYLHTLPYEVLLLIFDFCDGYDLLRLSNVCKRFYDIVCSDTVWIKKIRGFLITNQISERFRRRCNPVLSSPRTMLRISNNWQYGRYKWKNIKPCRVNVMPWLQMTSNSIWWSGGYQLCGFKRSSNYFKKKHNDHDNCFYQNVCETDICKFVLYKNSLISGHSNGDIQYWRDISHGYPSSIRKLKCSHACDINGIDATSQNIISGSNDGMIKIQKHVDIEESNFDENEINIDFMDKIDRVRSLAIDPTGTQFAVGSSGTSIIPPLHLINIETLTRYTMFDEIRYPWKYGAGILDMVWDNPHTLLTCGYDTCVRKWDLRIEKCVASWADPNDAAIYCVSSDYQYSIVTGTQNNGAAVLWDQRKCNFVQVYFISLQINHSSPIYSLQFDSNYMYCALDRCLARLNFSHQSCKKNDFKQYYLQMNNNTYRLLL
ncbi:F-box/WD repeat-containing protein 4 isoform X2 [Nylanderia fulva]|uniref:F-box/WD repeat-containing protein 4 isoform X2 n=1 Tax=Nylanderia fulva TaxID=613905 RepID=UPI0010FB80DF|nr:F-box/WD repeat-containing protein 4 isoform X2 [Nylanderia fulva]